MRPVGLGVMLALTLASAASAQTYRVLRNFTGGDGAAPDGVLVVAGGTLYGTTTGGGSSGNGVVFQVNTDGSGYTVLKNFSDSDGWFPQGGLVLAGNTLYGTTFYGGSTGYGVVFKVNTDGSGYAVLKSFTDSDGSRPMASLALAGNTLYGTTWYGGSAGGGVVFKVNTDGSGYTVIKNFTGSDGLRPAGHLVIAGNAVYGTTFFGGSAYSRSPWFAGYGLVFKVNTDGTGYAVLKNFTGSDGWNPNASLVATENGTLYGTTWCGGSAGYGVVFQVNTDGSGYAVLKNFTGSDGAISASDLVLAGGTLYGTAQYGGSSYSGHSSSGGPSGDGVVFKLNTDGSGYAVLKSFTGSNGSCPYAGLALAGSTLYGTTSLGGDSNSGVVFSLAVTLPSVTTPPWTQTAETGATSWFSVEVTDTPPESTYYQWYFGGTGALSGATNSSIELTNVQPSQAGAYTVVVSNLVGAVTSAPALLSVVAPVDRSSILAVQLTGASGSLLHVEQADSLVGPGLRWTSLTNTILSSGPQLCFDLSQPRPAQRFYRAWQSAGPAPALNLILAPRIPLSGKVGSLVEIDYINQFGPTNAWVMLDTVTLTNSPQLYFDVTAFRQPPRLYRLLASP